MKPSSVKILHPTTTAWSEWFMNECTNSAFFRNVVWFPQPSHGKVTATLVTDDSPRPQRCVRSCMPIAGRAHPIYKFSNLGPRSKTLWDKCCPDDPTTYGICIHMQQNAASLACAVWRLSLRDALHLQCRLCLGKRGGTQVGIALQSNEERPGIYSTISRLRNFSTGLFGKSLAMWPIKWMSDSNVKQAHSCIWPLAQDMRPTFVAGGKLTTKPKHKSRAIDPIKAWHRIQHSTLETRVYL